MEEIIKNDTYIKDYYKGMLDKQTAINRLKYLIKHEIDRNSDIRFNFSIPILQTPFEYYFNKYISYIENFKEFPEYCKECGHKTN